MQEVAAAHQTMMDALHEVFYETVTWTNRQRGKLTEELLDAGIPHSWNGDWLTVLRRFESVVDRLVYR
jgi:hypothetical protein